MRRRLLLLPLVLATTALAVGAIYACVPADTRPPPATVTLTVSPSPAVTQGFTTADGWRVTFQRVLVAMGNEGLSDSCTVYGEADYDRVLDLQAGSGQKLGILHGLGKCDLRFRIAPPSADAVQGAGVSDVTKEQMRIPAKDAYTVTGGGGGGGGGGDSQRNGSGTAIDIALTATRDGVAKQFHLIYRRRVRYQKCTPDAPPADASAADLQLTAAFSDAGSTIDLPGPEQVVFDLVIEPEAVLRDDPNPTAATLRFDGFANADKDGDGIVTLDELRATPITTIRDAGAFEAGTYDVDDAGLVRRGKPIVIETLGDYVTSFSSRRSSASEAPAGASPRASGAPTDLAKTEDGPDRGVAAHLSCPFLRLEGSRDTQRNGGETDPHDDIDEVVPSNVRAVSLGDRSRAILNELPPWSARERVREVERVVRTEARHQEIDELANAMDAGHSAREFANDSSPAFEEDDRNDVNTEEPEVAEIEAREPFRHSARGRKENMDLEEAPEDDAENEKSRDEGT